MLELFWSHASKYMTQTEALAKHEFSGLCNKQKPRASSLASPVSALVIDWFPLKLSILQQRSPTWLTSPLEKKKNLAEHRASGARFHPVLVTSSKSFSSQMHRSHQTLCAQASSEAPASQPTPGKQGFPRKWRLRGGQ